MIDTGWIVNEHLYNKILGCLSMVAIGDALGMPSHDMTADEIRKRFKGPLRDFRTPFKDSRVHAGMRAAQVTDDTLLTLSVARAYIDLAGAITPSAIAQYTADTARKSFDRGLEPMFGPSTKKAIEAIDAGLDPVRACLKEKHPMAGASNGGAMKTSPAGLFHPGDINAAIEDAVKVCLPSHATQTAISAACAIAAGISEATTPKSTVFSVIKAALSGAQKGEAIGKKVARNVPLPSVPERIRLAVSISLKASSRKKAILNLANIIGSGLPAYESIPTAIGIFLACDGDPKKCVLAGANIGNDTDTIASMAGALAGTLRGFKAVPKKLFSEVEKTNDLNLKKISADLAKITEKNLSD